MKKYVFIPAIFIIFLSANLFGQLNFEYDFARFQYTSDSSYVEFYYQFDQNSLAITNDNGKDYVSAYLKLSIYDTLNNTYIVNNQWQIKNEVIDTASKSLVGSLKFIIPNKNFGVIVEAWDQNNTDNKKKIVDNLSLENFYSAQKSYISDIELASNIVKDIANPNSLFYKNTLEVVPQPNPIFGDSRPLVFYYCELYNLNLAPANARLSINLINSRGKIEYAKQKNIAANNSSVVEIGAINISKFPTDSYYLKISLGDSVKDVSASIKKFYIYNPKVEIKSESVQDNSVLASEYAVMSDEECDDLFEKSKFILQSWQISKYKELSDIEAKRKFLFELWKKLDSDPETPENEFKTEYLERVKYSNEKFSSLGRKGMKTDRGRVYILYGQPDQIDRYPNSTEKKPYEIWSYNSIEGGIYFVFGDIAGFGNYELLHSTKRGEVQNDDWEDRLTVN